MEAPPSPLSSRPKRSEVEGSAVRPSPLPTSYSQTSTPNRGVIPTGAQRSGGTCCSSSTPSDLMKAPLSPLSSRPERSVVEGSAVRPSSLPNLPIKPRSPSRSVIPSGPDFLLHCSHWRPRMWFSLKRTTYSRPKPQLSTGNPGKPRDLRCAIRVPRPTGPQPLLCHPERL